MKESQPVSQLFGPPVYESGSPSLFDLMIGGSFDRQTGAVKEIMNKETEREVTELVKEESREQTAMIMVNLRQIYAEIATLRLAVQDLEEMLYQTKRRK